MKVVIDSNVFISCLNSFSPFHDIFRGLLSGRFHAAISTDIALEYLEVFKIKFVNSKSDLFFTLISECPHVIETDIYFKWKLITADPDDNKFVDCAIAANADYIITNDKHFNILKQIPFPKVECITVEEFMNLLQTLP